MNEDRIEHTSDLVSQARKWLADDPDPQTRAELSALLESTRPDTHSSNLEELRERFAGPLEFGTAGLRGLLGAGPSRMNRRVVQQATAGLCAWVKEQVPDATDRGICIGYDGRHMSVTFAQDAAEVAAGAGFQVHLFDRMVPTPLLAFAAVELRCAAAIMVTASHNPPQYNGYKVYWENGAQIIPPHDQQIAARIASVSSVAALKRVPLDQAKQQELVRDIPEQMEKTYLSKMQSLLPHPSVPRKVSLAYTALHGVGEKLVRQALQQAGFEQLHSVPSQAEPDPGFPTVAFPNPEEEGAMDRVLELGAAKNVDVVLANDPDADRLAVALRTERGDYTMLTGNELGCLLAHYCLEHTRSDNNRLVVSSVVSSPMLGVIAEAHGARWEQTLTGFKWIANRAMELEREEGYAFVFGYEEALGYSAGNLVRDKDGISAALLVADYAAWASSQGRSLLDELHAAWERYGMYLSEQKSKTLSGLKGQAQIKATMQRLRAQPPEQIGPYRVEAYDDLQKGHRVREGHAEALPFAPSNVLSFHLQQGHRVMFRPSGTEPKLKQYFDVRVPLRRGEAVAAGRKRGEEILASLIEATDTLTNS